MTDQPPEDQPPTRAERLAVLADKLCRSYTYGVGIDELAQTDPDEAEAHRDAAEALLDWIGECPREERRAAFRRGYDRGREAQKQRTAEDMTRLEAELAELRQERDPEGLRSRICDLTYALRGWDMLMTGRGRRTTWEEVAAGHLAKLVEVQRELAELKGHQPSNASRRDG
ncbi:hypothetical protein ACWGH4_00550 [Streptomyces sp. NPDC054847]